MAEEAPNRPSLKDLLKYELIEITGDGNCLFRAFSKSIYDDEEHHETYRADAANYIEENWDQNLEIQACAAEDETKEQYIEQLRSGEKWGGDAEIKALSSILYRQVKVFMMDRNNNNGCTLLVFPHQVERPRPIINLLFSPSGNTDERAGHYDLMRLKIIEPALALGELTDKLRKEGTRLKDIDFSARLQTSFLKRDVLDVGVWKFKEVDPVLEIISDIARQKCWFRDDETKKAIYDVLCYLQSLDVLGDPEKNMFCWNPVVILVHIFAFIVYYPLMFILMVLLVLGRVQGWVALITGFAGVVISAVSVQSESDPPTTTSQIFATASQVFGIITGILTAAKGISFEQDGKPDYMYTRVEDLTIEVLRRTFGNISKVPVFQPLWGRLQSCCGCGYYGRKFNTFAMTLMVKKADIRKVQDVRMFFFVVLSTSLVQDGDNFSYIVKMNDVLKRIEGVLIDPNNYLTLQDMESKEKSDEEENFGDFCFKKKHANAVKDIYKKITPVKSFCTFLQELNDGTYSLEPKDDMAGKSEPSKIDKADESEPKGDKAGKSAPKNDDKKPKNEMKAPKDKDPNDKKSLKDNVRNFFTSPKSDKADKSELSKGDEETGAFTSSPGQGKGK